MPAVLELVASLKSPHFTSIASSQASNTELTLNLGYSHPVVIPVPKDIQVLVRRSPFSTSAVTSSAVSTQGGDAGTGSGCCAIHHTSSSARSSSCLSYQRPSICCALIAIVSADVSCAAVGDS